jgi:hypothetical protein
MTLGPLSLTSGAAGTLGVLQMHTHAHESKAEKRPVNAKFAG